MALLFAAAAPNPAGAQEPAGARERFEECREDAARNPRATALDAIRACLPDGAAFVRCVAGEPAAERIEACIAQQMEADRSAEAPPSTTEDSAAPTSEETPTTEAAATTEAEEAPPPTGGGIAGDEVDTVTVESDGGGFSAVIVALAAILGIALGAGIALLLGRGRRSEPTPFGDPGPNAPRPAPAPAVPVGRTEGRPATPPASAPAPTAADTAAAAGGGPDRPEVSRERDELILGLIDLADQVQSEALRAAAVERLAAVGVEAISPKPGATFDPTIHRGVHATPAASRDQANTIASLDRPGWSDRGRTIRPPEVVVHVWEGGDE